ncbi:hypothetical protein [Neptuniibacter sp. QD37_11]|uniref:hypothetical protein n=1 Tax=Neptuniibacter sp. QD37_11 TaxID=3398209 RepID=UPI0039F5DB65
MNNSWCKQHKSICPVSTGINHFLQALDIQAWCGRVKLSPINYYISRKHGDEPTGLHPHCYEDSLVNEVAALGEPHGSGDKSLMMSFMDDYQESAPKKRGLTAIS